MTIRRATEEVEIKEGDFILGSSVLPYGICGRPGKVTLVRGKRLYYDRILQDGSGLIDSTHMNRDQVKFVCDTREEVDALMQLSETSYRRTSAAVRSLEEEYQNGFEGDLQALIGRHS